MNRTTTLLLATLIMLGACQKSIEEFTPYIGQPVAGDSAWVSVYNSNMPLIGLKNDLRKSYVTDPIIVNAGAMPTQNLSSGVTIYLENGFLTQNTGALVSGTVNITSDWVRTKGDIIRAGSTTKTNGSILKSSGQFFISLTKDNAPVSLSQNARLSIKYQSDFNSQDLKLYKKETVNSLWGFNWVYQSAGEIRPAPGNPNMYEIHSPLAGWLQAAEPVPSFTGNLTIQADLTPFNTNANTMAYLVFDDITAVLPLIPDTTIRKFRIHDIAPNKRAKLVVMSKMGSNYYWGIQSFITGVTSTQDMQNVPVTPRLTTLAGINSGLDML